MSEFVEVLSLPRKKGLWHIYDDGSWNQRAGEDAALSLNDAVLADESATFLPHFSGWSVREITSAFHLWLQPHGNPKQRVSLYFSVSVSGAVPGAEQTLRTAVPKSGSSCAARVWFGSSCRFVTQVLMCPSSGPGQAEPVGCCDSLASLGSAFPLPGLLHFPIFPAQGKLLEKASFFLSVRGLSPLFAVNTISFKPNSFTFPRFFFNFPPLLLVANFPLGTAIDPVAAFQQFAWSRE